MNKIKKEARGGKREGAGRKERYSEPTTTVAFRCPASKVDALKLHVAKFLATLVKVDRS